MFNAAGFNQAFNGALGQPVGWRQAMKCPCVNPNSGAADPACPICGSKGVYWLDEVDGKSGVSNQSQKMAFANFGEWQPGDALLTIPSDAPFYLAGQYDRFRIKNSLERFNTSIVPGANDKLLGSILTIDSVQWVSEGAIIQGGIPKVGANGSLTFTVGAPPANTSYVVNGVKYVEFYSYLDLPGNRNIGVQGLPRKLPVRRFDLFGR